MALQYVCDHELILYNMLMYMIMYNANRLAIQHITVEK